MNSLPSKFQILCSPIYYFFLPQNSSRQHQGVPFFFSSYTDIADNKFYPDLQDIVKIYKCLIYM